MIVRPIGGIVIFMPPLAATAGDAGADSDVASRLETQTTDETDDGRKPDEVTGLPPRGTGWSPGQYLFNRTRDGGDPSTEVVRRRFWRNVGSTEHAQAFGQLNAERLAAGRPPARLNPRTHRTETMALPVTDYVAAEGRAPSPAWPDADVDPYAAP